MICRHDRLSIAFTMNIVVQNCTKGKKKRRFESWNFHNKMQHMTSALGTLTSTHTWFQFIPSCSTEKSDIWFREKVFPLSSSFAVTRRCIHVSEKGRGKWRWAEEKSGRSKQGWISQVNRHPLNSLTDTKSDKPLPSSLYSRFLLTTEHVSSHERKESSIIAYKRNGCNHSYSLRVDTLKEGAEAWVFNAEEHVWT